MKKKYIIDEINNRFPTFKDFPVWNREQLIKFSTFTLSEFARWLNEELLKDQEAQLKNQNLIPMIAEFINSLPIDKELYHEDVGNDLYVSFFYGINREPLQAIKHLLSKEIIEELITYYKGTGFSPYNGHEEIDANLGSLL